MEYTNTNGHSSFMVFRVFYKRHQREIPRCCLRAPWRNGLHARPCNNQHNACIACVPRISCKETSGRHLGGIWEASGMHLGGIWEVPGGIWEASGGSRAIWGVLGGSRLINAHHSQSVCVFPQKVLKRLSRFDGRCHQVLRKATNLDPHSPPRRPPGAEIRTPALYQTRQNPYS